MRRRPLTPLEGLLCASALVWCLLFMLVLIPTACGPRPTTPAQAADDVQAIRFVWHPEAKLCFGMLTYWTYSGYRGTSITVVPDRACGR